MVLKKKDSLRNILLSLISNQLPFKSDSSLEIKNVLYVHMNALHIYEVELNFGSTEEVKNVKQILQTNERIDDVQQ